MVIVLNPWLNTDWKKFLMSLPDLGELTIQYFQIFVM